ncbi:MAG: hypothetical protein J7J03_00270 [Methanosarcinales archaeon]|nr:hypothetical protein [Methanosarcinales archaeon]MCD6144829.1 hypothetical protein [Methanosarcinales archaeon]
MSATTIEALEKKVNVLEAEISTIKRSSGVKTDRKDLNAWGQLEIIGAEISKLWKSEKPSWQLISETRR